MQGNHGTAQRRFGRGFTQAGGLLDSRIQKTGAARGFANIRLLTHWEEIVGKEIASIAKPQKLNFRRKGLGARLTLLAKPAHAPELQMHLPRIKERVNASYGYSAVADIRITQTGEAMGFAEPRTGFIHDQPAPRLSAKKEARLKAELAGVGDDTLRARLERLGKNILTTSKGQKT